MNLIFGRRAAPLIGRGWVPDNSPCGRPKAHESHWWGPYSYCNGTGHGPSPDQG